MQFVPRWSVSGKYHSRGHHQEYKVSFAPCSNRSGSMLENHHLLILVKVTKRHPRPTAAAPNQRVHRGTEQHRDTARPRNQAQHDEIRSDADPEAENGRASEGEHENGGLEAVGILSAVAERGDGAAEKETAEKHQCGRWIKNEGEMTWVKGENLRL